MLKRTLHLSPIACVALLAATGLACNKPATATENPAPSAVVESPAATQPAPSAPTPTATATAAPAAAPAGTWVAGETWRGSYMCNGQGETQAQLQIKDGGNKVEAVFDFQTPKNSGTHRGISGSYKMAGPYNADTHHLRLVSGAWINRPAGFVTGDLDGQVSGDGRTFSGLIRAPGCSTFSLHRAG